MKKAIKMLAVFAVIAMATSIGYCAKNYTVDVTTNAIDNTTSGRAGFILLVSSVSSQTSILKISLSNSDASVAQVVTIYENCKSTASATKLFVINMASGTVNNVVTLDFDSVWPLNASYGIVVRKSSASSSVQANILTK